MPEAKRQLAAIMFTDIVGYTALMGKDSAKALEIVRISKEIQKPLVEKHNGKWLKEMGDGAMAQFSTALDAVNCSIEIQKSARAELDAKLRIGIHSGDITTEDDDVYGDGVNVASRLESIADPGGIYISESIEKAVQGQSDVQAKYLGEVKLKNVAYGVRTYALQGVGLPVPEVKDEKELSGHFFAELQRRGVLRAGIAYVVLSLLFILLVPYADSLLELPIWSTTVLFTIFMVGFPIAIYLAWNYERSPEGFVRTSSKQSWQNPYATNQRKPFTSNFIIIGILLIIIVMYGYPQYLSTTESDEREELEVTIDDKSIAVLAFTDMSPNKDQEYFSDGISEEILNLLTKIPELKVIARTSSFSFKGKGVDIRTIGKKLGVAHVLEGSVRKDGNTIRVTTQLIRAEDGVHLWSETYNREMKGIFTLQDEIARSVVDVLKVKLVNDVIPQSEVSTNVEAYNFFYQGKFFYDNSADNALYIQINKEAMRWFKEAIRVDSSFALAWTYLSMCHWRLASNAFDPEFKLGREAAERALLINPNLGTALVNIAEIQDNEYDFVHAEKNIKLALEMEPNNPYVLRNAGRFYTKIGRLEESIALCERALEIDPIKDAVFLYLAIAYFNAGQYDKAASTVAQSMEELGYFTYPWYSLDILMQTGSPQDLLREAERHKINIKSVRWDYADYYIAAAKMRMGKMQDGERILGGMIENKFDNYAVARTYAHVGQGDKMFKYLEESFANKEKRLTYAKVDPVFVNYRRDSRFVNLLEKMNFID